MKTLKYSIALLGLFISSQIFAALIPNLTGTYSENTIPVTALPATLFDGNTTINAKQFVGYQNAPVIIVDLGAKYDLTSIKFFWGATYYAMNYQIFTSPDNATWTFRLNVGGNTNNTSAGDLRTLTPSPTYVRYIKITYFGSNNSSNYLINLHEIQVDGVTTACVNDGVFKNINICENANFVAVTASVKIA